MTISTDNRLFPEFYKDYSKSATILSLESELEKLSSRKRRLSWLLNAKSYKYAKDSVYLIDNEDERSNTKKQLEFLDIQIQELNDQLKVSRGAICQN